MRHARCLQKVKRKKRRDFTRAKVALMLPRGAVMCGVEALTLTDHDIRRLSHPLVGGVILFSRNVKSRQQLRALCDQIHALRSPPLVIGIDQEGGRVRRLRPPRFAPLPAMGTIGKRHQDENLACRVAYKLGKRLAAELIDLHIDFSFAPVLDLDYGVSAVIGNRAFGRTPEEVTRLAGSFCKGLRAFGVATVGKHFPGHGYVAADSHTDMPEDHRAFEEIAPDIAPYRALLPYLSAVMMAHVRYPKEDEMPAGFSSYWVNDILRKNVGFSGAVFSDDLGMEGAKKVGDWVARADASFIAGCDVVLACNEFDAMDFLLEHWKPTYSKERFALLQKRWRLMLRK